MSSHSAILGGSNAARLLACPASYLEQKKVPYVDTESSYAAEGTALHEAIAQIVKTGTEPRHLEGLTFYGHTINTDQVTVLEKALATLMELLAPYGGLASFKIVGLEQELKLPDIPGAFGSVDLILVNEQYVVIVDWKFGAGVAVKALYSDEGGEYLNPQLAFYTIAARAKHKRHFKGKRIVAAIIQPRLEEPLSFTETDNTELDDFQASFHNAFVAALSRDAHRERGDHCRFASCKATCELWTGPVFDLAWLDPTKAALEASVEPTGYGNFLTKALNLAAYAEEWVAEIRRQSHVFLTEGGTVPGYKLVPKRANRTWIDAVQAETALADIVPDDNVYAELFTMPELKSVAQTEKVLKKHDTELPPELWHAVSSGTTIAPTDDARPDASHDTVIDELQEALKAI